MRSNVVGVIVLAQLIAPINATELEVFARPLDIVVDHVDEDRTAEQALLLQNRVNRVQLVPDCLLLLLGELRLLGALTTQPDSLTSLDLKGREHVLEA